MISSLILKRGDAMTSRDVLRQGQYVAKEIATMRKFEIKAQGDPRFAEKFKRMMGKRHRKWARSERAYEFVANLTESSTVALIVGIGGMIAAFSVPYLLILGYGHLARWIVGLFS
ncbi:MAG: hypothetical protein FWE33_07585 [Defluviitaleaceae bacterium]|nr:hypothetical protein [Defluviitaleaceae bacterium]